MRDSHFHMFYVLCLISCMHTLNFQTYFVIYICGFNYYTLYIKFFFYIY